MTPNHVHGIIALYAPVGAPLVGAHSADRPGGGGNWATTRVAPTLEGMAGASESFNDVPTVSGDDVDSWLVMPNHVHGIVALFAPVGATLVVALVVLRRKPVSVNGASIA